MENNSGEGNNGKKGIGKKISRCGREASRPNQKEYLSREGTLGTCPFTGEQITHEGKKEGRKHILDLNF